MYVKERKQSFFLDMLEDNNYALFCIYMNNALNNDYKKYLELQEKLIIFKRDLERISKIEEFLSFFKNKYFLLKINRVFNYKFQIYNKIINDVEKFEALLAYMIINGILSKEQLKALYFDNNFVDYILKKYNNLINNQYDTYYYDENTDLTYLVCEDGSMKCLSYKPEIVTKYIKNNYIDNNIHLALKQ